MISVLYSEVIRVLYSDRGDERPLFGGDEEYCCQGRGLSCIVEGRELRSCDTQQ